MISFLLRIIYFSFQICIENNPNEGRTLLIQNPQLAYALLQAQVVMKIIDPETAMVLLNILFLFGYLLTILRSEAHIF